jgi:hypothetical protein
MGFVFSLHFFSILVECKIYVIISVDNTIYERKSKNKENMEKRGKNIQIAPFL